LQYLSILLGIIIIQIYQRIEHNYQFIRAASANFSASIAWSQYVKPANLTCGMTMAKKSGSGFLRTRSPGKARPRPGAIADYTWPNELMKKSGMRDHELCIAVMLPGLFRVVCHTILVGEDYGRIFRKSTYTYDASVQWTPKVEARLSKPFRDAAKFT
jgi:hypothetical protein